MVQVEDGEDEAFTIDAYDAEHQTDRCPAPKKRGRPPGAKNKIRASLMAS
jgi:hypothetical protein